jgi:hypothetical protein
MARRRRRGRKAHYASPRTCPGTTHGAVGLSHEQADRPQLLLCCRHHSQSHGRGCKTAKRRGDLEANDWRPASCGDCLLVYVWAGGATARHGGSSTGMQLDRCRTANRTTETPRTRCDSGYYLLQTTSGSCLRFDGTWNGANGAAVGVESRDTSGLISRAWEPGMLEVRGSNGNGRRPSEWGLQGWAASSTR